MLGGDSTGGSAPLQVVHPDPAEATFRIIRATRQEEILEVRDLVLEYHAESRYAHLPFSEKKFIRAFSKALSSPSDTLAVYVQYRGVTIALLHAGVGDYYLGEGGRMVTVYAMYVSPRIRKSLLGGRIGIKLLRLVGDWARHQGAGELHVHSTSGLSLRNTDKLMNSMGFVVYGGNYHATISHEES
jgi:hypothetical protein